MIAVVSEQPIKFQNSFQCSRIEAQQQTHSGNEIAKIFSQSLAQGRTAQTTILSVMIVTSSRCTISQQFVPPIFPSLCILPKYALALCTLMWFFCLGVCKNSLVYLQCAKRSLCRFATFQMAQEVLFWCEVILKIPKSSLEFMSW